MCVCACVRVCVCVSPSSDLVTQSRSGLVCFASSRRGERRGREMEGWRDGTKTERWCVVFGKWVKRKLRVCVLSVCIRVRVCVYVMFHSWDRVVGQCGNLFVCVCVCVCVCVLTVHSSIPQGSQSNIASASCPNCLKSYTNKLPHTRTHTHAHTQMHTSTQSFTHLEVLCLKRTHADSFSICFNIQDLFWQNSSFILFTVLEHTFFIFPLITIFCFLPRLFLTPPSPLSASLQCFISTIVCPTLLCSSQWLN